MLTYPVTIFTPQIPKRYSRYSVAYARAAQAIQVYLNNEISEFDSDVRQFTYASIARQLRLDRDMVGDILESVGEGSNGCTVVRGNPDAAIKAMQERAIAKSKKSPP